MNTSYAIEHAVDFLKNLKGKPLKREKRCAYSIELASLLLKATLLETTLPERHKKHKLARMMKDPMGKAFLTAMTDQCFRSRNDLRTANQLSYLLKKFGIPRFFDDNEKLTMLLFQLFGLLFPHFSVAQSKKQIKKEFSHVLLPEDTSLRKAYFERCLQQGIRINLNHLGEAIIGEEEALRRLQIYLEDLSSPFIDYVSIKISTIYSQIHLVGWEETISVLSDRLRLLYREAMKNLFLTPTGEKSYKFVNLDMEEAKDLDLTVALFKKLLDETEFHSFSAGIVLQSYLPESFELQKELTKWAIQRENEGKAPIKIRIVKGANLAMEKVESSIKGWPQAPFLYKEETDANFRRMVEFGIQSERAKAVHIGIGTHNLFDIAYALILRAETGTEKEVDFEMLQGMAEPMRRVIKKVSGSMLVYAPEAIEKNFHAAVAYLIRRLDENTGPDNFLSHFFEIESDNKTWQKEIATFKKGCSLIEELPSDRRKKQNRNDEIYGNDPNKPFSNEPDTDFSLASNRKWAWGIYEEWEKKEHPPIPLVIGGKIHLELLQQGFDPSRPARPLYQYATATLSHVNEALSCAKSQENAWSLMSVKEKSQIFKNVANLFKKHRKDLIGAMIADAGKVMVEADIEVSEAIDLIEYYRHNWEKINAYSEINWSPLGTVLIAPPWNFPCSIPTGGITAALIAGNCVLFKPAPETILIGWHVVQQFWKGGIPKEVLQWINCPDEPIGSALVKDERLNGVVLTGATATARKLMVLRPSLHLMAETGGKNALIITSMSDRNLAIRDLLHSAFSHAGQKCSACSLAILEAEVYDDPHFLAHLHDAAKSLHVGSAWDPKTKIPPLIHPPEGVLKRGLLELEEGETWLLQPKSDPLNPHLWSPGIKLGVRENSFTHQTELFGPVLGLMRAENLTHAVALANGTPYGLTSGLHSLDEREHLLWKSTIQAGNLYINRTITGAIVRRQPFGGCKASSFGGGAKAGGPNYVHQLAIAIQKNLPQEKALLPSSVLPLFSSLAGHALNDQETYLLKKSIESYAHWVQVLKEPVDPSCLQCEDNYFFHIAKDTICLRVNSHTPLLDLLRVSFACLICETPLEISSSAPKAGFKDILGISFVIEKEEELYTRLKEGQIPTLRLIPPSSFSLLDAAAQGGTSVISSPVLASGRFELLHYLREISLSIDYHRYGNLGIRDPEILRKV